MTKEWWRKYSKRWLGEEFEPLPVVSSMKNEIDRIFDSFLGGIGRELTGIRAPLIDVKETNTEVIVTAELPGVKKGDVKLRVEENTLAIEAKSETAKEVEEEGYVHKERSYTGYKRAITLPAEVTAKGSTANYTNGVLTVTLKKVTPSKPGGEEITIE